MGPQREPRHRELSLRHVAVDLVQELVDRALPPLRQGLRHPLVTADTMRDERVDHVGHAVHQAAVAGAQGAQRRHLVAHAGQAGEVLVQVAVGRADDDRRSVHHVVAGEQQGVLVDQPAQVVGRVAGRVQRPQGEARQRAGGTGRERRGERPAFAHALVGRERFGRAEADDAGARGGRERGGAGSVVDMGVRHGDGADRPERLGRRHDGRRVRRVIGARVDDDRLDVADEIGVGPRPRHQARVRGGEPADPRCQLVDPARLGGGADAEVGHRWDHGPAGRGPGAVSGPSSFACMETARTASLKSPSEPSAVGSGTGARS